MRSIDRTSALFMLYAAAVLSQKLSTNWIGTWELNVSESKFAPQSPTVSSQILKIAETAGHQKVAGDTITTKYGTTHEEFNLNLDGTEAVPIRGVTISLKLIDDNGFDIIVRVNNEVGTNHFVFSPDGRTLTETKTRKQKAAVSVLVFHKIS